MLKEILQASAGTGKTYQIVKLGLEPAGAGRDFSCLRDTVFLSFSNAAAEEIKARLYKETAPKTASAFSEAIGGSEARVYTVHSFCFELARIFRYELGLPADARFPTEENTGVWENCVSDFFRSHWDLSGLALKLNLKEGDPDYVSLKALHLLGDRRGLRDFIIKHGQKVFFLGEVMDSTGAAAVPSAPPADIEELARELTLARLDDKEAAGEALSSALDKAVPVLRAARPVLERIVSHIGKHVYIPYMYSRGIFDFDSLVFLVVKLLKNMKAQDGMDAFLRRLDDEGFGFRRLFIDEAQDCDILMNALIGYFLAEKCPVETTLVGDAKQSVYRWRNAFPEEFLKMCAEAGAKRRSLLASYRIKNPNTLNFINKLVEKVASDYKGDLTGDDGSVDTVNFFDYKTEDDRLAKPEDSADKKWMTSAGPMEVGYGIINATKDIFAVKSDIEDFMAKTAGRTGVIFRSRSAFRNSKLGLMLGDKLQYRMSEPFEDKKEHGDNQSEFSQDETGDIDPDYYLLKTLVWCFTSDDRHKAAASLLLSRKGLELAKGLWPQHINNAAVSSPEAFIKAAAAVYGEIQSLYYGGGETSVSEKVYSLLKATRGEESGADGSVPGLWPVFFRPESALSPERTARGLNHALAGLYLHEISGVRPEDGDDILPALAAAKIPYESCLSYDIDMDGLNFAEAVTIHSSKGLTYEKVILLLDSNDMLKAEPDGGESPEEFAHLFRAQFNRVAGPKQDVTIDYFPYLGGLPAKSMRGGRRYPGLSDLYNDTFKRVKAEKADLFYVALTRTREHLMFLDKGTPPGTPTASGKKSAAKPPKLDGMIRSVCETGKITMRHVSTGPWTGGRPILRALSQRPEMALPGSFRLVGVRTDIKDLGELTAAPKISAGASRFVSGGSMNMYVGVRVHQIVAELMLKAPAPAEYDAVVRSSPAVSLDEAGRLAAEILLRPENKALLQPLFKPGVRNLPELRVWGLSADGKRLLNGIVDGVLVDPSRVTVLEYKTLFGSSEAQAALGEKQKERYIMLLGRLKGDRSIDGAVIGIKAE